MMKNGLIAFVTAFVFSMFAMGFAMAQSPTSTTTPRMSPSPTTTMPNNAPATGMAGM